MKKWLPWLLTGLCGLWLVLLARTPAPKNSFDLTAFGRLPVLLNGRVQPLDSVARNSLLQIRTRQTVYLPESRVTLSATEWLLEVLTRPEKADQYPIFRIDNGEVLDLLKLASDEKYFTFKQLEPRLEEIEKQADRVNRIEAAHRTPFERQLMRLYNAVALYNRLKMSLMPEPTDRYAEELKNYESLMTDGLAAFHARQAGKEHDQEKFNRFMSLAQRYERMARAAYPLIIPPAGANASRNDWLNAGASLLESMRDKKVHPIMLAYARMADGWRAQQAGEFNQAVNDHSVWMRQNGFFKELSKGRSEFFYHHCQMFYRSLELYLAAFVLGLVGLLLLELSPGWSENLRRCSFGLIALTVVVHTIGLIYRMVLEGRPPVTNLYSSAIFIGWAAVLLGLALEWFFRVGIGNLVASLIGFITLVIAHNLSLGGDTMEMLRAVLDTNFWLATHVVTITLGYSATFVAGLIGLVFVVLGVFTPVLSRPVGALTVGRMLSLMVYGATCFAILFSFIGTVLGGIWADQSWGRFWGWDPKENGALLIVIWNAVYLHARWGGVCRERGLMNIAIFGNIVTAWSWFGVNMLGVGLHSYGFMDSAFKWLLLFAVINAGLMLLSLLPERSWRSFRNLANSTDGKTAPGTEPAASQAGHSSEAGG